MSKPLPVIVAMGGVSPAGRTSSHRAYQRLVFPHAGDSKTLLSLAVMQNKITYENGYRDKNQQWVENVPEWLAEHEADILGDTLVRALDPDDHFDPQRVLRHKRIRARQNNDTPLSFKCKASELPREIPESWSISHQGDEAEVSIADAQELLVEDTYEIPLSAAGQFPKGFNPQDLYPSKSHARALSGSIFAISDAVNSSGLDMDALLASVAPDQVSVYAGSALSQVDDYSLGGTVSARFRDQRISSRHISFGLPEMAADFANAYALGATAKVGYAVGACATFLFNMQRGIEDIVSGQSRIAFIGAAECPIVPPLVEGLMSMGALVDDSRLRQIDGLAEDAPIDRYKASRPFCDNAGFAPGESCQFAILMDDELALSLGAHVLGSAACSYTHADGYKKSISGPGVGNYLTVARAMGQLRALLGDSAAANSFVLAHGSSTPQNRVTESHILNTAAETFGISDWPVVAIKSHLGHSMAAAGADQLYTALGAWQHGWLPGIKTADALADDVHCSHLDILLDHAEYETGQLHAALLNAKGFGGNNATALVLSPQQTMAMLQKRHGKKALKQHAKAHEKVERNSRDYEERTLKGDYGITYRFGTQVLDGLNAQDFRMDSKSIQLRGFDQPVDLSGTNPWKDMV